MGREICPTGALVDGGDGVEFEVLKNDEVLPAFAIRYRGVVYAYINRCSHMDLRLNFLHSYFYDLEKNYLICSTHGALYDPETGQCRSGPCNGLGLLPLNVRETAGKVNLAEQGAVVLRNEEQQ